MKKDEQQEQVHFRRNFSHFSECDCGGLIFHFDDVALVLAEVDRKKLREERSEDTIALEARLEDYDAWICEKCGANGDFPKKGGA